MRFPLGFGLNIVFSNVIDLFKIAMFGHSDMFSINLWHGYQQGKVDFFLWNIPIFNTVSLVSFMQIRLKNPIFTTEYFRPCRGIYQAKIRYYIKF